MSFTQRTQRSQRGVPHRSVFTGRAVARFLKKSLFFPRLSYIGCHSLILPWRPWRPLREISIFQSNHCKQRGTEKALRYLKSGNVSEKTRNEFHAKNATIAKRGSASICFYRKGSCKISQKIAVLSPALCFIGRYSLILPWRPWRPWRPLREISIFQSNHCKQRRRNTSQSSRIRLIRYPLLDFPTGGMSVRL
jgi:hypothetical protein